MAVLFIYINGWTLSSDNGCTRYLSKVTSSKFKELIEPVLIQIVGCTILSDKCGTRSAYNNGANM